MHPSKTKNMVAEASYFGASRPIFNSYLIAMIVAYTVVAVHTPITLYPFAMHDDGLFMSLGRSLAEGRWLGRFEQFTLMKGPGYPAFLAVANWLGISISLAHAMFHCFAITFFVVICHRFVKSPVISALLFALLLWHPVTLTVFMLRVFREQIYYAQVLVVLATFSAALFYVRKTKQRILFGGFGGAMLGWFWLTREEGIWIVPAIVVLVLAAALRAFRERRVRELVAPLSIVIAVFAATQIGFRAVNWAVYGKFVGVDVKETNFERALGALHSVRSGGVQAFVDVTRGARQRIYAVSPTFASLKEYFDGPVAVGWVDMTCELHLEACGEIGAGWFVWALRHAASNEGHYSSPTKASAFFGQMADEITSACKRGDLECAPQLISMLPPVSWAEIAGRMLPRYVKAFNLLLLLRPPLQFNESRGTPESLAQSLRFLNYPLHTRLSDNMDALDTYMVSGWYYRSGADWFSVALRSSGGSSMRVEFDRISSPDLQSLFKDEQASRQRFVIRTHCNDECMLALQTPDGDKLEKKLGQIRATPIVLELGKGRFHIDRTDVQPNQYYVRTPLDEICGRIRIIVLSWYHLVFVPVLILGGVAFLLTTMLFWKQAGSNACYALALASWLLVAVRTTLLVFIDATSFPTVNGIYLSSAYFLLVSGAVLSCAAWLQLSGRAPRDPLEQV
jgi:hypothetical protein